MPEIKIVGDSPTIEDGLGFDSYVSILLDAINDFDAESPLTIGIHGSWGSGKTSLMRMLERRFEDDKRVKTIWFNAWRYSKEDIIWRAFIMKLLYKLSVFQKLKEADLPKVFGELIKPLFSSNPNLGDIKEAFSYGQRIDSMDEFEKGFKKIVQDVVKDGRLIIFIDDLDRCLPEKTIEILEVIKLFLDVPRCVFVLGVEREVIERGIVARYKTDGQLPISGKDYIEKIIQVSFTLPPIREEDMMRFIEKLGIGEKERGYAEMVAKVTESNPRKVKMFLNALGIRQAIADITGKRFDPKLSAKFFAIESMFPVFYKDVVKYREQDFLCRLERLSKGKADKELKEELEDSETLQKYHKNEDLKRLLIDEPFFCGIDISPYIYLYGKPPEEVLVFDESVLEELLSGDGEKIRHAADAIKKMPESVKEKYLNITMSKLGEENEIERWRAARALGKIGDERALELLKERLKMDKDPGVRGIITRTLGKIGNDKVVGLLIELLQKETENGGVREEAAGALGRIGNISAVEPLIAALKDKAVRTSFVAEALGEIGDGSAIGHLEEAQEDPDRFVQLSVKEAIKKINAQQQEPEK
jgi:hypothetical protein